MSAQDLTFSELATATKPFVEGPFSDWWRADTTFGTVFVGEMDRLRGIVVTAPAESSELGRLTELIAEEDVVHDTGIRFGVGYFTAFGESYHDRAIRELAERMLALLFPDGVALVNKSYAEEAGRADARDLARTPEVRAQLARFPMPATEGPANFDAWMDAVLQPSTRRLGALLAQRDSIDLDPAAPSAQELLNAKRALITLVQQIFANYRVVEDTLDENARTKIKAVHDLWNQHVRQASARATARRRAAKSGTGAPPVTPPVTPAAG